MFNTSALLQQIENGAFDRLFDRLYGADAVQAMRARYIQAVREFTAIFGERDDVRLFSAPGRTEIGGNHTDHNHGCVLAASVNLDVIAVVSQNDTPVARVQSQGYPMDTVDLSDTAVHSDEINCSASLIRGTAARFEQLGYTVGGFDAYTTSNVLKGSGLSSSAAFEVLVGTILSHVYNDGKVDAVSIAKIAQYAENIYFGKPCGLMDQTASSVGGIITIDFKDTENPIIEQVPFDFAACGHQLCIVDVGGSHADLTHEYAAVPMEMKAVANELGVDVLRETSFDAFFPKMAELREKLGDRAVLRAMHFFAENARVGEEVDALRNNDFETFKELVLASGHSSFEYLQNIYANCDVSFQGMSIALALAQRLLDKKGAWRVHGGGFGGTTQNFVPVELVDSFRETMENVFGKGNCHILSIRPVGGIELTKEI